MQATRWQVIAALWLAGLAAAGQFAKLAVVLDLLAPLWPGAGVWLGLAMSVVGFVGILFGTSAGILVARTGARRMLIAALAAGAVLSLAEAALPPLPLLIGLRVAEGASHLAIVVAAPVLIAAAAAPRHQAAAMTLWSTVFALAFALAAALGRPLAGALGPGALFLVHGGLMAGAAALLARVLPAEPALRPVAPGGGLLARHLAIYRSPRIAAPALGFVFYTLMFVALVTLLPGVLDPGLRRMAAVLLPLMSIPASLLVGVRLIRVAGAVATVQMGFAVSALAAAGLGVSGGAGLAGAAAAFAIIGGLGLVQGGSFAAIPELNPDTAGRAEAAGAIAQLGNVGTTLGTPVLLRMIELDGAAAAAWFAAVLCLGGMAMHLWLARRRARAAG